MKTIFAIAFYCLVLGFLAALAAVIVIKLILWPPCTQIGNTCVVEPWSVAGLAGTVLAVAATVLAVLGAVAVAAWWTSLNRIVTERVQKLYKRQQKEVNAQVDLLLQEQQRKVGQQFAEFQAGFAELQAGFAELQARSAEVYAGMERSLALSEQTNRVAEEEKKLLDDLSAKINDQSAKSSRISAEIATLKEEALKFPAFVDALRKYAADHPVPEGPLRITTGPSIQIDQETPGAPNNGVSS